MTFAGIGAATAAPGYAAQTPLFAQSFKQATIAAGGDDVVKPSGTNQACLTAGTSTKLALNRRTEIVLFY